MYISDFWAMVIINDHVNCFKPFLPIFNLNDDIEWYIIDILTFDSSFFPLVEVISINYVKLNLSFICNLECVCHITKFKDTNKKFKSTVKALQLKKNYELKHLW